jgi:hypothetical protein
MAQFPRLGSSVLPESPWLNMQKLQTTLGGLGALGGEVADFEYLYNECAAILEFDGGLTRADAERKAFEYTLTEGDHYHAQKTKATN